jgi:hypothetical protein
VNQNGYLVRWWTNGAPVTNLNGTLAKYPHGGGNAQGLAVDAKGHVWVAHGSGANTVGHLETNGVCLGVVEMRLPRLRAQFFANTNLTGFPVLERADAPVNFDWGAGAPSPCVPADNFSARWSGHLTNSTPGDVELYVSADAGAGFRLTIGGWTMIDNWENPDPNPVELSATNYLYAASYSILLECKELSGDSRVRLSWRPAGASGNAVIPAEALQGPSLGVGSPAGISIDSQGYIWAANRGNNTAMRINPDVGEIVVTNGLTHHVGEVDMIVDLGNASTHPEPYNLEAAPYNYSDMTGFNNRVVNPPLQPLKGYWSVIHDSGMDDEIWQRVDWTDNLPIQGCSAEVFVRASNDRAVLPNMEFVRATKNLLLMDVQGRFIEVRASITRDIPSRTPAIYDITLYGNSSGMDGFLFLDEASGYESGSTSFGIELDGPGPMSYQWYIMPPWTNQWALVQEETSCQLLLTNLDQYEDTTLVSVVVSNAAGQILQFGPAMLSVYAKSMLLPATGSSGQAERYPATINVRGEPTNGLSRVEVTLHNLAHSYPADLDILLVSPSGAKIMLMSDAGASFAVTNATLVFHPEWQGNSIPPETTAIPSGQVSEYRCRNYGDQETQVPGAPGGALHGLFG